MINEYQNQKNQPEKLVEINVIIINMHSIILLKYTFYLYI